MLNEVVETEQKYCARRAIIFARVSDKDQEEGYSIDAQRHRLESYCHRRGLKIDRIFEMVESSTNGDRRQFMEVISYAKRQKETIAIVVDKIDRLQRSLREYPMLDELVLEGKIELHFNTENYVIHKNSKSQERVAWSLGVVMAQSYVDSLRDNVKRSINHKIRLGEWIAMAPIGYLNIRDERDRSKIILDPDRADLVRRIFEEFSKGTYTVEELTKKVKTWGLKSRFGSGAFLGKSKIYQILNNPFYYGRMVVKGNLYLHCYEPLIDKALFDQCQSILKGWHLKPFKWGIHDFVLRGLLTCGISGRTVSADRKKKRYVNGATGEWTYLRCSHPEKPGKLMWVREEVVLEQLTGTLKGFEMPPDLLQQIIAYIKKRRKDDRELAGRQMSNLQREHAVVVNRIDALLDLLLDQKVEKEEFDVKRNKLHFQKSEIEAQLARCKVGGDDLSKKLISLITRISNLYSEFTGSQVSRKRELLNFLFANLTLRGNNLLFSLRKPFEMFLQCATFEEWRPLIDALRTDPELRSLILGVNLPKDEGFGSD